jgi:hypothetical protein
VRSRPITLAVRVLAAILVDMSGPAPGLIWVSRDPTPVIEAYKRDVDRTLLRENLALTTEQRIEKMISVLAFAEELRRSRNQGTQS